MRLIIIGVIALIVVAGGGFAIVTFLLGGDEEPAAVEEAAEAEPEPVDTTESADLKPMVVPLMRDGTVHHVRLSRHQAGRSARSRSGRQTPLAASDALSCMDDAFQSCIRPFRLRWRAPSQIYDNGVCAADRFAINVKLRRPTGLRYARAVLLAMARTAPGGPSQAPCPAWLAGGASKRLMPSPMEGPSERVLSGHSRCRELTIVATSAVGDDTDRGDRRKPRRLASSACPGLSRKLLRERLAHRPRIWLDASPRKRIDHHRCVDGPTAHGPGAASKPIAARRFSRPLAARFPRRGERTAALCAGEKPCRRGAGRQDGPRTPAPSRGATSRRWRSPLTISTGLKPKNRPLSIWRPDQQWRSTGLRRTSSFSRPARR